jgi:hypothetical protein
LERRKANYLVRTVHRSGPGRQKLKPVEQIAATLVEAQDKARKMSKQYLYASTVIVDACSSRPIEFWNNGKKEVIE